MSFIENLLALSSKTTAVDCGELGTVHLKKMSGPDLLSLLVEQGSLPEGQTDVHMYGRLLVRCICDENGKREFADTEFAVISGCWGTVVDKLWGIARKMNALDNGSLSEIKKN